MVIRPALPPPFMMRPNNQTVSNHVIIIIVPLSRWTRGRRALEDKLAHPAAFEAARQLPLAASSAATFFLCKATIAVTVSTLTYGEKR
jgi:hypothetical protein